LSNPKRINKPLAILLAVLVAVAVLVSIVVFQTIAHPLPETDEITTAAVAY
jgi:ABC-type enterochelin transport system permease subunit